MKLMQRIQSKKSKVSARYREFANKFLTNGSDEGQQFNGKVIDIELESIGDENFEERKVNRLF